MTNNDRIASLFVIVSGGSDVPVSQLIYCMFVYIYVIHNNLNAFESVCITSDHFMGN